MFSSTHGVVVRCLHTYPLAWVVQVALEWLPYILCPCIQQYLCLSGLRLAVPAAVAPVLPALAAARALVADSTNVLLVAVRSAFDLVNSRFTAVSC